MKIAKVIASRREQWQKLETICVRLESGERSRMSAETLVEFSSLLAILSLAAKISLQVLRKSATLSNLLLGFVIS